MRANKLLAVALTLGLTVLAMSKLLAAPHGHNSGAQVIAIPEDNPALEFVGQFINTGTSSHQFGYIARIDGLDQVFNNATTRNETTAMFTFFTDRDGKFQLAALAEMSAPKISAMENEPRNLTIATLIRVAHALGSKVEIKLVKKGKAKRGRRHHAQRAA